MSDNADASRPTGRLIRTVNRTEIIEHLTNMRVDIDKSIHALPGILLGVSCASVIQTAMALVWHIDVLKGALVEAMLREGLNPFGEGEASGSTIRPRRAAGAGSRADYPPLQRTGGHTIHHPTVQLANPTVNAHVAYDQSRTQTMGPPANQTSSRSYPSTGEQIVPDRPPGTINISQHYADPYALNYVGFRDPSASTITDTGRYVTTSVASVNSQGYYSVDTVDTPSNAAPPGTPAHYQSNN